MPYLCLVEQLAEQQPKKIESIEISNGTGTGSVASTLERKLPPIPNVVLCKQRKLPGVKPAKKLQLGLKTLNSVIKSGAVNGIARPSRSRPPPKKLESSSACRRCHQSQDKVGLGGHEKQQRPLPQKKGSGGKGDAKIKGHIDVHEAGNGDGGGNATTFEGIMLSLQSPFPNEHELALGTCLRLSAVGGLSALKGRGPTEVNLLGRNPAILRMLLGHAGFYQDCGLRELMEETFLGALGLDFASFWRELCGGQYGLHELLCECYPGELAKMTGAEKEVLLGVGELAEMGIEDLKCCNNCQEPGLLAQMKMNSEEEELPFTLTRSSGHFHDKLERRVQLIGIILRNFSFQAEDAKAMARHPTMLRFLLVLAQIDHGELPQLAFDTISSISRFVGVSSEDNLSKSVEYQQLAGNLVNLMLTTVLSSPDRLKIICGLEALAGFVRGEDKQLRARAISQELIAKVLQLVTLKQDKILTMGCLEYILALSELGVESCDEIAQVQGSISTLMNYLNENSPKKSSIGKGNPWLSQPIPFNITPTDQESPSCRVPQPIEHAFHSQTASMQAPDYKNCQKKTIGSSGAVGKPSKEEVMHKIEDLIINNANTNQFHPRDHAELSKGHSQKEIKLFKFNTNGDIYEVNVTLDSAEQSKIASRMETEGLHPYLCGWEGCKSRAKTAKMLRWHVIRRHYPNLPDKSCCRWGMHHRTPEQIQACSMIRGKFSLQMHLEVDHCTEYALELALYRRKNRVQPPSFPPKVLEVTPIESEGDDGSSIVKQLFRTYPLAFEETNSTKEKNAVTKSIRLTAALILRNLAKYSRIARRSLSWYEPQLAEIATRGYDCSGMIAKLLYCISLGDNQEEDD